MSHINVNAGTDHPFEITLHIETNREAEILTHLLHGLVSPGNVRATVDKSDTLFAKSITKEEESLLHNFFDNVYQRVKRFK